MVPFFVVCFMPQKGHSRIAFRSGLPYRIVETHQHCVKEMAVIMNAMGMTCRHAHSRDLRRSSQKE
jgi:hypothetical protein